MDYCHHTTCARQILVHAGQPHKFRDTVDGQRIRWCSAVCMFADGTKVGYTFVEYK